jgi:hypothetical protein
MRFSPFVHRPPHAATCRAASRPRWGSVLAVLALALLALAVQLAATAPRALAGDALPAPSQTGAAGRVAPGDPAAAYTVTVYLPVVMRAYSPAPEPTPSPIPPMPTPQPLNSAPAFVGLDFVNSADSAASLAGDARIQRGADAGAAVDRFPVYWPNIEKGDKTNPTWDWSVTDAAIAADERHGLAVMPALLGVPGSEYPGLLRPGTVNNPPVGGSFLRYHTAGAQPTACTGPAAPRNLYAPIFTDGTDVPAPGKTANPDNPWARFVAQIANRYRPGGTAGLHVRDWEIWNEPDLCQFWTGSAAEYARLLKVAYLVIKNIDPQATVVWGGLAHFEQPNFLTDLIGTLYNDPMAAQYNGFFDAAGSHNYSFSWNSYDYANRIRTALAAVGWGNKPVWITESGVPICDAYPGPTCGWGTSWASPYRADTVEQASYVWQNIAYARMGGAGPILHFMLHDDCGNSAPGTQSPNADGFGLVTNEYTAACSNTQGPLARLSYKAYQLADQYLAGTQLLWTQIEAGSVRQFAFYDPTSHERRTMVFATTSASRTAHVPAVGSHATLLNIDGSTSALTPTDEQYAVTVPGATNLNWPENGQWYIGIYGRPYLLIEHDDTPPGTSLDTLPADSPLSFNVNWHAQDWGSGVASVTLWYQQGEGAWQQWGSAVATGGYALPSGSITFVGTIGQHYRFALLATDSAGNPFATLQAQAETTVSGTVTLYTISGQVIDAMGAGAAGATVGVGGVTATTDAGGHFSLQVPAGQYDVQVAGQTVIHGQQVSSNLALSLLKPPSTNAVTNGDFESGQTAWQKGGSSSLAVEMLPGTSDHALHLAADFVANPGVPGEPVGGNSTVTQQIQVPAGQPWLALRYRVNSQETTAGHDKFEIIVIHRVGTQDVPDYLLTQETSAGWGFFTHALSAYAGQTVTLVFNVYQSSATNPTSAYVDQVAVGAP